ncbi:MAG: hypothetical protein M1826_004262 [Phylliscum demangeonii]|nr:MAG: hypothetical protein M1826_004262 [Phylliscum demangeonii]
MHQEGGDDNPLLEVVTDLGHVRALPSTVIQVQLGIQAGPPGKQKYYEDDDDGDNPHADVERQGGGGAHKPKTKTNARREQKFRRIPALAVWPPSASRAQGYQPCRWGCDLSGGRKHARLDEFPKDADRSPSRISGLSEFPARVNVGTAYLAQSAMRRPLLAPFKGHVDAAPNPLSSLLLRSPARRAAWWASLDVEIRAQAVEIAIIAFYQAQFEVYKASLRNTHRAHPDLDLDQLRIRKVDGFQGGEAAFIVEKSRLNMAITRVRDGLIVVADVLASVEGMERHGYVEFQRLISGLIQERRMHSRSRARSSRQRDHARVRQASDDGQVPIKIRKCLTCSLARVDEANHAVIACLLLDGDTAWAMIDLAHAWEDYAALHPARHGGGARCGRGIVATSHAFYDIAQLFRRPGRARDNRIREILHAGNVPPWLTVLRPGQAYEIPLVGGGRVVKVVVLHRQMMPRMVPAAVVRLFDEACQHLHGDAFSTSFTRASHFLVAPVAQSANIDHAPSAGSRAWLQRFNALVGDLTGGIYRSIFSDAFCEMLETRAEMTNPHCPGSAWGNNPFVSSIQLNCSHPSRQVAGTAGATHRDAHDDPLAFSMTFNASVLRPSTRLGLFLFPGLGCAVPLSPGVLVLFSRIELHRGMPMIVDDTDPAPIPAGFPQETRFQVIAYPNAGIMNGRLERATPLTAQQHVRRHPTRFNLVEHSLAAFGSVEVRDEWAPRELARNYLNELHRILGREWVDPVAIYLFGEADRAPGRPPPVYCHAAITGHRQRRQLFRQRLEERQAALVRTSMASVLPIHRSSALLSKKVRRIKSIRTLAVSGFIRTLLPSADDMMLRSEETESTVVADDESAFATEFGGNERCA